MAETIRRLAACFDGTWNTERSNTNVSRLFRQIANEQIGSGEQRRFYDEGVGTSWGERIRGGVFGIGLDRNIRQGYAWLGSQFALGALGPADDEGFLQGPDIYLFGFSRGAFTARSLGGMINYLGLPKLGSLKEADPDTETHEDPTVLYAWNLYATRPTDSERKEAERKGPDDKLSKQITQHDANVKKYRATNAYYPARIP